MKTSKVILFATLVSISVVVWYDAVGIEPLVAVAAMIIAMAIYPWKKR